MSCDETNKTPYMPTIMCVGNFECEINEEKQKKREKEIDTQLCGSAGK